MTIQDTDPALQADGDLKYRIHYHSGGVHFVSEPLDHERAQAYADQLETAVVKVDLGERPLCDDPPRMEAVDVDENQDHDGEEVVDG